MEIIYISAVIGAVSVVVRGVAHAVRGIRESNNKRDVQLAIVKKADEKDLPGITKSMFPEPPSGPAAERDQPVRPHRSEPTAQPEVGPPEREQPDR
ncbi:hypothetical protein ACFQ1S_00505 [Kibdelosporangium lantanae]|uniref:Uncharacterized protein n=1 Tax=Kibdelosporangium lantanae TaxID=1497396 RepID=A0ABW3M2N4_9PSEU